MKSLDKLTLLALGVLALGSAVPAMGNLVFTTAGGFSGPNASGTNLVFAGAPGSITVSFSGAPSTSLPIPGTYPNQDLGVFDLSISHDLVGSHHLFPGNSFELVVTQSAPTAQSSFVNSSLIAATVVSTGEELFIDLPPGGAAISFDGGAEQYIVKNINPILIHYGRSASVEITGTVVTTPSPSSAVGGLVFCGLLFLGRPRRNPTA